MRAFHKSNHVMMESTSDDEFVFILLEKKMGIKKILDTEFLLQELKLSSQTRGYGRFLLLFFLGIVFKVIIFYLFFFFWFPCQTALGFQTQNE